MIVSINITQVWGKERQDRYGVVVQIEHNGNIFKFMPTYKQLCEIHTKLILAEELNKDKAQKPKEVL